MGIMGIISWLIFGLVIGAVARFIMPGAQNMGWLMTIGLGVVGSFAGGAISTLIFTSSDSLVQPGGWIMSIIGAIIVLYGYSALVAAKK